ncbi:gluconate 2-dehydrogenase subunit 3 family protein [Natrialbaceae archaeon GCM10025810]|uniref:gluconate 2-dehydrogenase subunit 3 family protein n=1 Tax=Halovalidus salilacus TaxID=3075124 RepID=UPI00360A818D
MELTRRDAVAALAALGTSGATIAGVHHHASSGTDADGDGSDSDPALETLLAAAEVVYPSELEGVEEFVETFLEGRRDSEAHAAGLEDAVEELDRYANVYHDAPFAELSPADRDDTLRRASVATVPERPDGTAPERIRYYVVNELLLALYTSPTGGELVGIENPQGYPGGLETYQRGSES